MEISTLSGNIPGKTRGMPDEDQMACRGDGKKLRPVFNDTENDGKLRSPSSS